MGAEATIDLRKVRPAPSGRPLVLDICAVSHTGTTRARNQDAWCVDPDMGLMLVADGVGGQGDGSWASRRAVTLMRRFLGHAAAMLKPAGARDREKVVRRSLVFINRAMQRAPLAAGQKRSGTTLVGLWVPPCGDGQATAFNVGDSSLFRIAATGAVKVSRDHSLHQLWVDGGKVGTEPSKRVIVQALGISPEISPHQASFALKTGETYLACTDGLTGSVPLNEIMAIAGAANPAESVTQNLILGALKGQARDNVTAAVCKVDQP